MPIPLGILATAGAAGGGGASYELIATTILNGNATDVTFSSIPSDYAHLQLRIVAKNAISYSNSIRSGYLTFNGDTATNYNWHHLYGQGSSMSSIAYTNQNYVAIQDFIPDTLSLSNIFGGAIIDILDYKNTNKFKTVRYIAGARLTTSSNVIGQGTGNWRSTNAITSLNMNFSNNFVAGSRFSLYGIKG